MITQHHLRCANSCCRNLILRRLYKKSLNHYCSQSCAATINNRKFPKRIAVIKHCNICKTNFTGDTKYCSQNCRIKSQIIQDAQIIKLIKDFYKLTSRIPFKKEFKHVRAARARFGSWNNAIKAAGFDPNPVKFARKHIAKDGHKCDSLAEKIIDDWLFKRNVPHEIHIPYNKYSMSADFKVNGFFIEFIGLQGELKAYDDALTRKEKMLEENNINVIKIYPQDLFPKNRLGDVLKDLF